MFAVGLALLIPFTSFVFLKCFINPLDALAISATYGLVSAVTFLMAMQFLSTLQKDTGRLPEGQQIR